jgi:trehalose utilization protein
MKLAFAISVLSIVLGTVAQAADPIQVVVWDERQPAQKEAYPNFLGNAVAEHLKAQPDLKVTSVGLDDPDQGLPTSLLDDTDVLVWWGHQRHGEVKPELAKAIVDRIKAGKLSLFALHSAHWSKPFIEAMNERARTDARASLVKSIDSTGLGGGADERAKQMPIPEKPAPPGLAKPEVTPSPLFVSRVESGVLKVELILPNCAFPAVRNDGKPSHVKVLLPSHAIAKGVPATFDIPQTEMYADPFQVPKPDVTIFEEKWDAGESFKSGLVWQVGEGTVVYFRPGHETYPIFDQPEVMKIVENTVRWLGTEPR